jgi:hypothetical protein
MIEDNAETVTPTHTKGPGAHATASPRVLTFSVSLYVRQGLNRDIRMKRVYAAVDHIEGLIRGAASHVFPWADKIETTVTYEYRWLDRRSGKVALPATSENSV